MSNADLNEALWRKLGTDIDLYKFYLDIAVKAGLFVFGITGAMAAYVFSGKTDLAVYALPFPLALNVGFTILFHYSVDAAKQFRTSHEQTCESLAIRPAFNLRPLESTCSILSIMFLLAAIGLAITLGLCVSGVVPLAKNPGSDAAASAPVTRCSGTDQDVCERVLGHEIAER